MYFHGKPLKACGLPILVFNRACMIILTDILGCYGISQLHHCQHVCCLVDWREYCRKDAHRNLVSRHPSLFWLHNFSNDCSTWSRLSSQLSGYAESKSVITVKGELFCQICLGKVIKNLQWKFDSLVVIQMRGRKRYHWHKSKIYLQASALKVSQIKFCFVILVICVTSQPYICLFWWTVLNVDLTRLQIRGSPSCLGLPVVSFILGILWLLSRVIPNPGSALVAAWIFLSRVGSMGWLTFPCPWAP